MLFTAKKEFNEIEISDDFYILKEISEVETTNGWKYGKDLVVGDKLITDEGLDTVKNIVYKDKQYFIYV